jgi:hypothetical protein
MLTDSASAEPLDQNAVLEDFEQKTLSDLTAR